jgi:tetratricopeptide (TPR) repeat protein
LNIRRSTDGRSWVLVHPRCARDRAEDLDEVQAIVEAGELDVAVDEVRWLLSGCPEFIAAHALLGELAVAMHDDLSLARGHFGAGYQLGLQTLRRAKMPKPLAYSQPANRPFFDAGRGLVWSLEKLGKRDMAEEVFQSLLELDPSDPLRLRALVNELRGSEAPIVDLSLSFPKPDDK